MEGFRVALRRIRREYNTIRPHEALGDDVPSSRYQKSSRRYQSCPPDWEYHPDSEVYRVRQNGCVFIDRHEYFACEALAGELVALERLDGKLVVIFRDLLIRELDKATGRTIPLAKPIARTSPTAFQTP